MSNYYDEQSRLNSVAKAESSLDRSLTWLREQGLRAVDAHSLDGFRRVLSSHVDLLALYLKARHKFRHGMQSYRLTNAAFLGYESNALYRINGSIEELIRKSIQAQDLRISGVAAYGLTGALAKALDSDAFRVFSKVLDIIKLSFALALNVEDATKRKQTVEIFASAVENFGSFNLVSTHLDEAADRMQSLPNYGKALISSLSGVLKETIDRDDVAIFSTILNTLAAALPEGHRDRATELYSLELLLHRSNGAARAEIEKRTGRLSEEVDFFREVTSTRDRLIYSLGAWAVKRYDEKKLGPIRIQDFMARIFPWFPDFVSLTLLHAKGLTQSADSYGWSLWEAEPSAFSASQGWLSKFYVIAAVRVLRDAPSDRDRDYVYRKIKEWVIPSSSLELALKEVQEISSLLLSELPKWKVLLPEIEGHTALSEERDEAAPDRYRFSSVINFWEELLSRRRRDEERELLLTEISEHTKTQFSAVVKKNWVEYSLFRKLAIAYGFFEDHTSEPNVPVNVQPWGIQPQLQDKMWFVPDNQLASKSLAEHLGRSLGELETQVACDAIASLFEAVTVKNTEQGKHILDAFIDSISEEKIGSYVLFSIRGFDYATKLFDSDQFERLSRAPSGQESGLQILAKYRKVPIIEVWGMGTGTSPCGVCVPIREMGIWHQYWGDTLGEELAVGLTPINEAKAESLLSEWSRRGQQNSQLDQNRPEAILNLRKKIVVQVWERFSYVPQEGPVGIKIILPPSH
jgi:hypothetical protein